MANNIKIEVLADVKNISKGMDSVNNKLSKVGELAGKVGSAIKSGIAVGAAAVVGGGLVKGITDSISAASDLNETMSKSQTVFGGASKDIEAFANNASRGLGLSKQEALAGAAQFGNLFDQIGVGKKAAADMSKGFLQMSADLGSFNNADPSQVMEAFQSATRGEFDSLQQFIPTLNAATLQTEALRLSHKKSASQLTEADKANALYSLSVKGMGKAQGDFARTSGGLANQQRILSARLDDAKAALGQKLLPIALKVVTFFNTGFGPATQKVGAVLQQIGTIINSTVIPPLQAVIGFVQQNSTAFLAGAAAIGAVVTAIGIYKGVMTAVQGVTKAFTAVQAALNIVMALNPVTIVVLAIIALAAAFVVAYKKSETFRNIVNGAFNAVKTGVVAVINFFKTLPGNISKAVGNLAGLLTRKGRDVINGLAKGYNGAISAVAGFFRGIGGKVAGWIGNAAGWLVRKGSEIINGLAKGYNAAIGAVASFFKGIAGRVLSAIGNLGKTLYSHGSDLVQGLINGIAGKAGALLQKAKDLAGSIKKTIGDALKIGSPSKVMIQFGGWVADGLAIGMKKLTGVKTAAAGLAGAVATGFGAPKLTLNADANNAGSSGGEIHLHLEGATFIGVNEVEFTRLVQNAVAKGQKFLPGQPKLVMSR